ncbi:hypothetical protein ACSQ67_024625 [Phaseolus vulgaris]
MWEVKGKWREVVASGYIDCGRASVFHGGGVIYVTYMKKVKREVGSTNSYNQGSVSVQFSSGIADLARCEGGIAVPFPCQGPQQLKGGSQLVEENKIGKGHAGAILEGATMLAPKSGKVDVCECEARMKDAIGAC